MASDVTNKVFKKAFQVSDIICILQTNKSPRLREVKNIAKGTQLIAHVVRS